MRTRIAHETALQIDSRHQLRLGETRKDAQTVAAMPSMDNVV